MAALLGSISNISVYNPNWAQQVTGNCNVSTTTPIWACHGDVHYFPCPHCDKCKCGKATLKNKAK